MSLLWVYDDFLIHSELLFQSSKQWLLGFIVNGWLGSSMFLAMDEFVGLRDKLPKNFMDLFTGGIVIDTLRGFANKGWVNVLF